MSRLIHIAAMVSLAPLAGCPSFIQTEGRGRSVPVETAEEIVYAFDDASVPPEFHRSYTITLTPTQARVVVDSYGDVLADEEYEISAEQFDGIKASVERNDIRACNLGESQACSGGTGERVAYSDSDQALFSEYVYHCGGDDFGTLCGEVAALADDMKALIPDFDQLLSGTRE